MIRVIRQGSVNAGGSIKRAGTGFWSSAKTATGTYEITLSPALPVAAYSVQVQLSNNAGTVGGWVITDSSLKTASKIVVKGISQSTFEEEDHAFEFSAIVVDDAYESSGIERAEWGYVDTDGTILQGGGFTVDATVTGRYDIAFITPMSSINYGISVSAAQFNRRSMNLVDKTVNGFTLAVENPNGDPSTVAFELLVLKIIEV